ncbi:hypothetical protein EJB05_50596, partial [Eragrostis curvula]
MPSTPSTAASYSGTRGLCYSSRGVPSRARSGGCQCLASVGLDGTQRCFALMECGSGTFAVASMGNDNINGFTYAYVYSSEQLVWSEPISIQDRSVRVTRGYSAVQAGTTVYCQCLREDSSKLLAYELCKQQLSFVSLPSVGRLDVYYSFALKKADEGKLGLLMARQDRKLFVWSRKAAPDGDADWTQQRVFELDKMLPSRIRWYHYVLFAAPSRNGVIVIKVYGALFIIDLKSGGVTELLVDGRRAVKDIYRVFPYLNNQISRCYILYHKDAIMKLVYLGDGSH